MMILYNITHPNLPAAGGVILERQAVRAVILDGKQLLLLYTQRYDDYSFPGGGVDAGESPEQGLAREVREETGAAELRIGRYLGYGDEHRPARGPEHDVLFMRSHFYLCQAARILGDAAPESYELSNGMVPRWIGIADAIAHNEAVLQGKPSHMGMSIHRETLMLKYVAEKVLGVVPGER